MFSRNKKNRAGGDLETQEQQVAPSILSRNLHITGNLVTEGDIQVDGTVDGDIKSVLITVGVEAVVNGAVVGDTVRVDGTVNGQINGRVVQLGKSAKVSGDIIHESLAVEAGAFVHGMCRNIEQDRQRPDLFSGRPSLVVASDDDSAVNLS